MSYSVLTVQMIAVFFKYECQDHSLN